jgi:hypothetical protein
MGYAFGALDSDQTARVNAVADAAIASAAEAQRIAGSASGWWANLIGASSSYSALQTDAKASVTLRDVLVAKRDRILSDPNASEADVLEMEGATYALPNTAMQAGADLLTPGAAVSQTFGPIPGQLLGGIPWWGWAGGAIVALSVLSPYLNRRRK